MVHSHLSTKECFMPPALATSHGQSSRGRAASYADFYGLSHTCWLLSFLFWKRLQLCSLSHGMLLLAEDPGKATHVNFPFPQAHGCLFPSSVRSAILASTGQPCISFCCLPLLLHHASLLLSPSMLSPPLVLPFPVAETWQVTRVRGSILEVMR